MGRRGERVHARARASGQGSVGAVVSACMHGLERLDRARRANLDVCDPVDHDPNAIGQVLWLELACGERGAPW